MEGRVAIKHRLAILGAALLFSTGGAAIKSATLTNWQVAGFRSGVAVLALILLAPAARRGWDRRVLPLAAVYAATVVLFVSANKLTTAANAIFLQSAAPIYVMLAGPWLLKEPLRRSDVLFMLPVIAGLALFFVSADAPARTAPDPALGNLLGVLSGVMWAGTLMGMRWLGRRDGPSSALPMAAMGNLLAFLACLPLALPAADVAPADIAVILYLGIFQIGVAYLMLGSAVRHVGAVEISMLLLLEPALNPVWAWILHDEKPSAMALAGGALILGATAARTAWAGREARAARGR